MKFTLFKTILLHLAAAASSSDESGEFADAPAVLADVDPLEGGVAASVDCVYPSGDGCDLATEFCDIGVGSCPIDPDMSVGPGVCTPKPQMCTYDYNPVCGCDGKTYPNECSAHAAGANVNATGACPGDYCAGDGNSTCWKEGFPQCCLAADQPCPPDRVPRCDNHDAMGWDYCTWSPDKTCYPSNNGHPECCARFDGTNCPPEQPNCENPPEVSAVKFLRG